MKTLEVFISTVDSLKSERFVDLTISGFEFKRRLNTSEFYFEIHCTRYALNYLRFKFGYLPEKEKSNQSNDNEYKLNYHIVIDEKVYGYNKRVQNVIDNLKELNKYCRCNYSNCISLGSNSCDQKLFAPHTIEKSHILYTIRDKTMIEKSIERAKIIRRKVNDKTISSNFFSLNIIKNNMCDNTVFIF